jgi:hypothetical protein
MKFKLPKNIISNNVFKNVLYLVSLALTVSYIINEQNLALMSLILIACGVYIMNKSVVIALFISIIATNLLLSMNYLKESDVIEGMKVKQQQPQPQPQPKALIKAQEIVKQIGSGTATGTATGIATGTATGIATGTATGTNIVVPPVRQTVAEAAQSTK